jgi:uncharacterized protein (TIGR00251 family)
MKYLNIKVSTRQSKNSLTDLGEGYFKAKLKSAPVDNKANQELIELVASTFQIPKSSVTIVSGVHHREKLLKLEI